MMKSVSIQRVFRRLALLIAGASGLLSSGVVHAAQETPDIVNIINFIRGVEPRTRMDLIEPVRQQLALARKHDLPTTYLIQYDALINPAFTDLLKKEMGSIDEIGVWLEVVQPQVEAAGLKWRGRYPWDWHTDVGFTQGYSVEDRIKVLDVFMAKFKEVFGSYPKSAGSWIIDAPTLNHLHDKYGIRAACNCKDQSGTDGYTLWGGYWNQAYYPSRLNAFMPAQTKDRQLDVPIFRMLGSDPVHQYDQGIGGSWQGVVTLEPVYRPGGGSPRWVDWFFDTNFNRPSLAFSYMQAGQENSFGWRAMSAGLIDQYAKLAELKKRGKIRVETLGTSGEWFRSKFKTTPATAVVALEDSEGAAKRSVWYESKFYRVNFCWEDNQWRIRDLHLFNEDYPERYLNNRVNSPTAIYDTLPVMDGFHWSKPGDIAGIRAIVNPSGNSKPLVTAGVPKVTEHGTDSLAITSPLASGGALQILCEPERLVIRLAGESTPSDWALEIGWAAGVNPPIAGVNPHGIGYQHEGFGYSLVCGNSRVSRAEGKNKILVAASEGSVSFSFNPHESAFFWNPNGGGSGVWDAKTPNWNASLRNSGAAATWPGSGGAAVFSTAKSADVTIDGEQEASSVQVQTGDVSLTGGGLRLSAPAVLRAESSSSLTTVGTSISGNNGLLLEGDGKIRLGGEIPVSGPCHIATSSLELAPGTRFTGLSRLGVGRSVKLDLKQVSARISGPLVLDVGSKTTLGDSNFSVAGDFLLRGAGLVTTGKTEITAGRFIADAGDGEASVKLSGRSALNLRGGTNAFELNNGSLELAGSSTIHGDRFSNGGKNTTLGIGDDANLRFDRRIVLGDAAGASVKVSQTGGHVLNLGNENAPAAGNLANRWGHWPGGNTVYEIRGGSLELGGAPLYLSWDSPATLDISGSAAVKLSGIEMGWGGRTAASRIRMSGGELVIGVAGIVNGGSGTKQVEFRGGTLAASANWSSSVDMDLSGALKIDTLDHTITLSGVLAGNGSLTKTGSGTLELTGSNRFTGMAAVDSGRLSLAGKSSIQARVEAGGILVVGNPGAATVEALSVANDGTMEFHVGPGDRALTVSGEDRLHLDGIVRIRVLTDDGIAPGTYPLIRYSGSTKRSASFQLIENPAVRATVKIDPSSSVVNLVVQTAAAETRQQSQPPIQKTDP